MAEQTVRQYYLLLVLQRCGMYASAAVYPTFLLHHGLNLFEINVVNTVYFVTLFLFEVPTGAFADVFGRKKSFVLSCGFFVASMLAYGFSDTFWEFVAAEVLAAVAHTFASGAFDAWFVDKLRHHGHTGNLRPFFARASQIATGVALLSSLAGAFLFELYKGLPWFLGAGFHALAGGIALVAMKEEYFVRHPLSLAGGVEALRATLRASVRYGVRNTNVRFIMVLVLALNFATMAPNMQWQPFFGQWATTQIELGVLWAAMALSLMLGAQAAPYLLRNLSERSALLLCHAITALGILGTTVFGLAPALALFLAHEVSRGAFGPIKTAYLHDQLPSNVRATLVSFESISHHVGGAIGLVVSGALAHYGSLQVAWTVSGCILLLAVLWLRRKGA